MFERIVDFSLKNRGAVLFLTLVVAVAGYAAFRDLTIEAFPDPTDTQVNVITLFPGQPTEEVERQIGLPIERALNGTPGVARLRSLSLFGLSFVTLTFHDGVDALFARQQVLERLRDADLPQGITPELGPLATPIGEIYRYTVRGGRADPMQLRTLQDWVIRPELMRVLGVADVVSYGGLVREIQVQPDTFRLAAYGLTLDDLEQAITQGSVNASGGILERGAEQFVVRSEGLFANLADVRLTRVATHEGTPVFLKDVAAVVEGWAPRQGVVSRGANYDTVEGIVLMRRGENPSVVLERLRAAVGRVNGRLASDGVAVSPFYDRSDLVHSTLLTVGRNLGEGALLVVLVLFAFLLDLRAALIVATLIPLSLLSSFIYLRLRGMSANLLSMGAVDFGIIVDGAVVIVESILHRLTQPPEHPPRQPLARIALATKRVLRPTIFSLLIIIAAYLPIFMLQRVEGRTFAPMSNTVVAALTGALFFSVTLIPVLAALVYRKGARNRASPLLKLADRLYLPVLGAALRRPFVTLATATGLLALAVFLFTRMGSEFLPELNEGGLYLTFTLPSNISLSEGRRLVPRLTKLWASNPAVEEVASQLGRPEDGTDATLTNNLEFFLRLKPQKQWPADQRALSQVISHLKRMVDDIPGLEVNFSQPIRDNVNENISGQFGQIAVKLYGEDLDALAERAEAVKNAIARVRGVADLGIVKSGRLPQIRVSPDRVELARYGMSLGEFQHVFQTAIGGRPVSTLWEGERRFDVVMRLPLVARDDMEKIRKLRIPVAGGVTVPLEVLAGVSTGLGRAGISRENGRRYIGVRMNVRGRDLGGFVEEARQRVAREAPLSRGMSIEWGGEFESKERAMDRLLTVVPVALLVTLLLLFKAFDSFPLAVLTLLTVPFGLMGGVFGLRLADMPLSVAAAVGFIALIGQASLNGVLVVSAIHERMKRGEKLHHAIHAGCKERLRPVLMTALLAALGLVPAALSRAMGAETQRPIAVVIVTGTLSACAMALIVLPVLYSVWIRSAPASVIIEDGLPADGLVD